MGMITKRMIDEAMCGMDIYENVGWTTTAFHELYTVIALCGGNLAEVKKAIKEMATHNTVYEKGDNIFEADGETYQSQVVYQVEFEIALNWLGWKTKGELNRILAEAWEKQHAYNQRSYKNEDFSHFHWRMTD